MKFIEFIIQRFIIRHKNTDIFYTNFPNILFFAHIFYAEPVFLVLESASMRDNRKYIICTSYCSLASTRVFGVTSSRVLNAQVRIAGAKCNNRGGVIECILYCWTRPTNI